MQGSTGELPRKKGTGNIRRYANGVWQASFSHHGKRLFMQAISRDEATKKLNLALQFAQKESFDGSKDLLDLYLKENGYPAGVLRELPAAISSYNINRNSPNSWRVAMRVQGKKYRIGAVSEEEAKAKYRAFEQAVQQGAFTNSEESLDEILKAAGFPAGRFHGSHTLPKGEKHGPFRDGVRLRKEGFYEGRYCLKGRTESIYAHTEKEARKKLRAIQVAIDNGTFVGKNKDTFCGYLMSWLDHAGKTSLRPSTKKKYRMYIQAHFLPHFGERRLQEVTTEMLQGFFDLKACSGRADGKEGGLSHKTLTDMRNMLKKALNYAVNPKKLIDHNPAREVELKFHRAKAIPLITEEQENLLVERGMESDSPIGWAVVILLRTGMRKGELLGLQLGQIGSNIGFFRIEKSLTRMEHPNAQQAPDYQRVDTWAKKKNKTGLYLGPPKTDSSIREFPVGSQVKECVRRLIAYQERLLGYSVDHCPNHGTENFLLVTPLLRPYDPKTFDTHFKRFLESCGVKNVTVHSTRHSFITEMVQRHPEDLPSISEIVGHADKSTTLRYSHGAEQRKKCLMDSF